MNADAIISFILLAIPFYLAFNVFVIGIMLYMQSASKAALNWPSVQGKILSSRVHYTSSYSKSSPSPWVEYTYEVDGKKYKSMTIARGGMVSSQTLAEDIVARYPKGADVTVYYDPGNPSKACLEKKPPGQAQMRGWLVLGNLMMPLIVLLYKFLSRH
jgi:hypothetical protein